MPMSGIGQIDLSNIPVEELEEMHAAGECVRECYRVLKRTNDNIVSEYLKRQAALHANNQNIATPVVDPKTNSEYLFHSDPSEEQPQETGHFHTFVRPRTIPRVGALAPMPRQPGPTDAPVNDLCHIIAIAMDRTGFPTRLFAPNKWVTGVTWYKAADVCHYLPFFTIEHAEPSYPVNIWITNMLVLFRPQIQHILSERDRMIAVRRRQHPEQDVLEDRSLAVTVDQTIDVSSQFIAVREALRVRTGAAKRVFDTASPAPLVAAAETEAPQSPAPLPGEKDRKQTRENAVEAALQQQIHTLHNAVISAKTTAHALEEQVESARRQAWQREKEHEREIEALRAEHESEMARRLTAAKTGLRSEFQKAVAATRAEWQTATEARLESARKEARDAVATARAAVVDELRMQWNAESREVIAEMIEARKVEEARRLTAAKERWARAGREAVAERDRVWQVAFEHRVEAALDAWRADEETRLAQAKAEWNAERRLRQVGRRRIAWWLRRIGGVLLIAAVIGGGAALYPVVKPAVADMWNRTVVANVTALSTRFSLAVYLLKASVRTLDQKPEVPVAKWPSQVAPQRMINVSAANLRSAPSRTGAILGILLEGTQVSRLERRGQWVRVRTMGPNGQVGWVHNSLLADLPAP